MGVVYKIFGRASGGDVSLTDTVAGTHGGP
jgi:hypothetical protein